MSDRWAGTVPDVDEIARLDTGVPHIARVYDYCLGGKDNFAADREAAEEFIKAMPDIVLGVREARAFLARAVGFLAGDAGVRQFLDIDTILGAAGRGTCSTSPARSRSCSSASCTAFPTRMIPTGSRRG
jgi:hypothetical protein